MLINFWIRQHSFDTCLDCDHGHYSILYLDRWRLGPFPSSFSCLTHGENWLSNGISNSCVSPNPGFGLRFHVQLGLGKWTGTGCGNRFFTLQHFPQALTPWVVLLHIFNLPHVCYSPAHLTLLDFIMITKHEAPYYAVFSMLVLVSSSQVQNSSSHLFLYTLYVRLLIWEPKPYHAKQEAKL